MRQVATALSVARFEVGDTGNGKPTPLRGADQMLHIVWEKIDDSARSRRCKPEARNEAILRYSRFSVDCIG